MGDIDPRDVVWRLTLGDDEVYEFSRSEWMNAEAREVKKWLDMNPPQFWVEVGLDNPDALTALVCILRRRNGQPDLKFSDTTFNYGAASFEAINLPDESPDPTRPASTSTTRSGTRTRRRGSSSSPNTTSAPGSSTS